MKTCLISHLCSWGHLTRPQECGYKKEIKKIDACYNLLNLSNCENIITIISQERVMK